ncbi:MAG: hypothetical protein DRQ62_14940 [Gammaproteobacteria bacterium]|nr:MAG: hypothetical protein DRQ62_14940 [Gammaproteobacteria bacterium]
MENLARKNREDFTINENGDAFISQMAISRSTGIPQSTISDWIRKWSVGYNTNELNQLDAESLQKLVIFGSSKYPSCLAFMGTLLEAGAKAYIYHQAGYKLDAIQVSSSRKSMAAINLGQLTAKDYISFLKQIADFGDRIVSTQNIFTRKLLIAHLKDLCDIVGHPMPDIKIIAHQMDLLNDV